MLRQAIIDILQFSSPNQHFLKSKILHSSVFRHVQLLDPTSQKWVWKTGYKNNPRDNKKTIVALSCFRPYLTTKLHMVMSVWIFSCKRLKLKKWFKHVELEATHNHHFQKPLYISRIKFIQESSFSFSFINNILLLPIKKKFDIS